ncbi:hypothetical protein HK101_002434 [Irineochytrium annulatum]|nr:hypothetical protein HK101_002434 [Irineochytrium annulatum]
MGMPLLTAGLPDDVVSCVARYLHPYDVRRVEAAHIIHDVDADGVRKLLSPLTALLTGSCSFACSNLTIHLNAPPPSLLRLRVRQDIADYRRLLLSRLSLHRLGSAYLAAALILHSNDVDFRHLYPQPGLGCGGPIGLPNPESFGPFWDPAPVTEAVRFVLARLQRSRRWTADHLSVPAPGGTELGHSNIHMVELTESTRGTFYRAGFSYLANSAFLPVSLHDRLFDGMYGPSPISPFSAPEAVDDVTSCLRHGLAWSCFVDDVDLLASWLPFIPAKQRAEYLSWCAVVALTFAGPRALELVLDIGGVLPVTGYRFHHACDAVLAILRSRSPESRACGMIRAAGVGNTHQMEAWVASPTLMEDGDVELMPYAMRAALRAAYAGEGHYNRVLRFRPGGDIYKLLFDAWASRASVSGVASGLTRIFAEIGYETAGGALIDLMEARCVTAGSVDRFFHNSIGPAILYGIACGELSLVSLARERPLILPAGAQLDVVIAKGVVAVVKEWRPSDRGTYQEAIWMAHLRGCIPLAATKIPQEGKMADRLTTLSTRFFFTPAIELLLSLNMYDPAALGRVSLRSSRDGEPPSDADLACFLRVLEMLVNGSEASARESVECIVRTAIELSAPSERRHFPADIDMSTVAPAFVLLDAEEGARCALLRKVKDLLLRWRGCMTEWVAPRLMDSVWVSREMRPYLISEGWSGESYVRRAVFERWRAEAVGLLLKQCDFSAFNRLGELIGHATDDPATVKLLLDFMPNEDDWADEMDVGSDDEESMEQKVAEICCEAAIVVIHQEPTPNRLRSLEMVLEKGCLGSYDEHEFVMEALWRTANREAAELYCTYYPPLDVIE